jgi:protein SCO1/2
MRLTATIRVRLAVSVLAATFAVSGCATRHVARGLVLRVDERASTITLSHEAIPGFMEAMAMAFSVKDRRLLGGLKPGDRVRFRLVVRERGSYIDRLDILSASPGDLGLLASPAAPILVPIGQEVPDFELRDQDDRPVSLGSLRGQVVAVNFIYTRCPLPDYCPRIVNQFRGVRERLGERLGKDVTLLTITFDPKHDTPETLRAYAAAASVSGEGWHFLTGPADAIGRVCASFGVEYWPDEGLLTHSLQTAVIDRNGRLAATVEGKDASARQLADLIEAVLETSPDQ